MNSILRKFLFILIVVIICFSLLIILDVKAQPRTITVPDDYPTIQEAINFANEGDTVLVRRRTYNDQAIKIDKSLSLIGEGAILKGKERPGYPVIIKVESDDVKISGFTITEGTFGISGQGNRTQIIGNQFVRIYQLAISLDGSFNTIVGNSFTQCPTSIQSSGYYNNISGNNLMYWGAHGILVGDSYSTISNNNLTGIDSQIVVNGNSNIISGNIGAEGKVGIKIESGSNHTIFGNNLKKYDNGIILLASSDNVISENTITDNFRALYLSSKNNTLLGNYIANNTYGIDLNNMYNTIIENIVTNNSEIGIFLNGAGYNNIVGNNITNNGRGISVSICYNNTIYHNNFVNNTNHIKTDDSNNIWNDVEEGNYWDNFNGTDRDGNGIGDTPYLLTEGNIDNYPLMFLYDIENDSIVVPPPEPFPTTFFIVSIAVSAVVGLGILVYFKKRRS